MYHLPVVEGVLSQLLKVQGGASKASPAEQATTLPRTLHIPHQAESCQRMKGRVVGNSTSIRSVKPHTRNKNMKQKLSSVENRVLAPGLCSTR